MKEIRLFPANIKHSEGHAYIYCFPKCSGDCQDLPKFSKWRLYENNKELGPAHSLHTEIKQLGRGKYSHWDNVIYFSSSDNTNPCNNGRQYCLMKEGFSLVPVSLLKILYKIFFKRNSLINVIFATVAISIIRFYLFVVSIPKNLTTINISERKNFIDFYKDFVEMFDDEDNGCLFTIIFIKYVERKYFKKIINDINDPSLEVGVLNGVISKLYLNYPFTTGAELFYDYGSKYRYRMPHKNFIYFNLIEYEKFKSLSYNTIVMIHSIDDFTHFDTEIIFKGFSYILRPNGNVYFSGYSNFFSFSHIPYKIVRFMKPKLSFYDFRSIYDTNLLDQERIASLSLKQDLDVIAYEEFNKDPLFILINSLEDYLSKLFIVSKIRKLLWKNNIIKKIHIIVNSCIAIFLLDREYIYATKERETRGINFFCIAKKPDKS